MQRRRFLLRTSIALAIGAAGFSLAGSSMLSGRHLAAANVNLARRRSIDASVNDMLERLYRTLPGARELIHKAYGVLVFPAIFQTSGRSFSFRGLKYFKGSQQYGEGALRADGGTLGYYSTVSSARGNIPPGAPASAMISLFMTQDALDSFRHADSWSVSDDALIKAGMGEATPHALARTAPGVTGSARVNAGAGGNAADANANARATIAISPVKVSVLTSGELMDSPSLSGAKVTRLKI